MFARLCKIGLAVLIGLSTMYWSNAHIILAREAGPREQVFVYLPIALRPTLASDLPALKLLFDEGPAATQFADATGKQAAATCTSPTCPQAGLMSKMGSFVRFDGVDDVLRLSGTSGLDVAASEDLSIGLWLYPTDYRCGYCRLVNKFDGTRGYVLDLADNAGHTKLAFFASDGTNTVLARSRQNVLLNAWHHLVAVLSRGGNQVKLYLDGVELPLESSATLGSLGNLTNAADIQIGHLGTESSAFQGMIDQLEVYKRALTVSEIASQYSGHKLPITPNFHKWNSQQAVTVLKGFGLSVPTFDVILIDLPALQVPPAEGVGMPLPSSICSNCTAWLLTYTSKEDWDTAMRQYNTPITRAFGVDNIVLVAPNAAALSQMNAYTEALTLGMLQSIFDAPTNATPDDFLPWANYYPASRGQQRDSANHKSQRTYDRWEGPNNEWLFGQSTWLYQDPDNAGTAPPGLPITYENRNIDYFIQAHCEKEKAAQSNQDCLNLEIFIETLSTGADESELFNWWSGGWGQLVTTTPNLWTFYNPAAVFVNGNCNLAQVQAQATDAQLQDAANRVPLRFRLSKTPGAAFYSPDVCALIFNTYLLRKSDVTKANNWRVSATTLASTVNTTTLRSTVQAENRYFERLAVQDGDVVYRRWAREIYWMREISSTNRLDGGFESFWWGERPLPIEDNLETNPDPTWSPFEYCRLDKSQGPAGWGRLVCEANP